LIEKAAVHLAKKRQIVTIYCSVSQKPMATHPVMEKNNIAKKRQIVTIYCSVSQKPMATHPVMEKNNICVIK